MFRPLLSLLLLLPSTQAVLPTDFWNGKFTTTNWFSDIYVCSSKSTSTGIYYVQGVANKVAYLRGNSTCADSTCTWDGRVYYAGREAVSGSFSFVMSTASGFSGTLSLNGGLAIKNVAITGTKTNNIRPAADLCLESDVDYIESKKPMYSGQSVLTPKYPYEARSLVGTNMMDAYAYKYEDGRLATGQIYGNCAEDGQVCANTWYEQANDQGIEVWVGKNSTFTYNSWSVAPLLSSYKLSYNYAGNDEADVTLDHQLPGTELAAADTSSVNFCISLPMKKDEQSCLTYLSSSTFCDCNCKDGTQKQLIEVAVAFSILTCITSIAVALKVFIFTAKSGPMASSSSV